MSLNPRMRSRRRGLRVPSPLPHFTGEREMGGPRDGRDLPKVTQRGHVRAQAGCDPGPQPGPPAWPLSPQSGWEVVCDPSSLLRGTQGLSRDTGYPGCCWLQRTPCSWGPNTLPGGLGQVGLQRRAREPRYAGPASFQTGEMSLLRPDLGGLGEGVQGTSACPGNPVDEA